jgi:hypothetical protein
MKLTVKKPFSWAHKGISVEAFEPGQTIDTEDQDLIDVSTKEGWTSKGKGQPQVDAAVEAAEAEANSKAAE